MTERIRILIADDHAVVRHGLRALIATEPDLELVGEATDGVEAVEQTARLHPDVILMDMAMPRKTGLEAIYDIKRDDPQARIVVLTSFAEDEQVFPAIKAGALGYLLKDSDPEDLITAIRNISLGEPFLHPSIARKVLEELSHPGGSPPTPEPLTERGQLRSDLQPVLRSHGCFQNLAEFGLGAAPGYQDPLDHIAVELEFMHFLCAREIEALSRQDSDEAQGLRAKQRHFLEKHLAAWVPQFTITVETHAHTLFYRNLAVVTRLFIASDAERLIEQSAVAA